MEPKTISEKSSADARQSMLSRWKAFGGVGLLLLLIIIFRVYWWQKIIPSQGKSSDGQPQSFISSAERSRIDDFRGFLNSLSKSDLNSIQQGEAYFQAKLLSLPARGKDMAFLAFSDFYYQVAAEYNEKAMRDDELLRARLDAGNSRGSQNEAYLKYLNDPKAVKQDPQIQMFMELLYNNGLQLILTHDGYFISELPGYLADHFGKVLSEALRTFLKLRKDDLRVEIFSADGALLISYRDLGEKVILWERFLDKYPGSLVSDDANYYYQTYLDTLLGGTTDAGMGNEGATGLNSSNAGIFDERGILKPQIKRDYYNFKSKYPNTKSGKLIDQFYDILLHNKFKRSRQVEEFYRENQIKAGRE
jgi:hypothetical protein